MLLIVLVVLVFIFSDRIGGWARGTASCEAKGGTCGTVTCEAVTYSEPAGGILNKEICAGTTCIAQPGTTCSDPNSPEIKGKTSGQKGKKDYKSKVPYCCMPLTKAEPTSP